LHKVPFYGTKGYIKRKVQQLQVLTGNSRKQDSKEADLMPKSKRSLDDKAKWFNDCGMPAREGMYFYLIIAVSLLLPIVIAVCVFFTDIFVTLVISGFLLSVLGFLIYAYRKVKKELQQFDEALEKLNLLEGDHEISLFGGLLSLRIEENPKELPPPPNLMLEEKRED